MTALMAQPPSTHDILLTIDDDNMEISSDTGRRNPHDNDIDIDIDYDEAQQPNTDDFMLDEDTEIATRDAYQDLDSIQDDDMIDDGVHEDGVMQDQDAQLPGFDVQDEELQDVDAEDEADLVDDIDFTEHDPAAVPNHAQQLPEVIMQTSPTLDIPADSLVSMSAPSADLIDFDGIDDDVETQVEAPTKPNNGSDPQTLSVATVEHTDEPADVVQHTPDDGLEQQNADELVEEMPPPATEDSAIGEDSGSSVLATEANDQIQDGEDTTETNPTETSTTSVSYTHLTLPTKRIV